MCVADILQVLEAKIPQAMLVAEGEDARIDNRCVPFLSSSYIPIIPIVMTDCFLLISTTTTALLRWFLYSMLRDDRIQEQRQKGLEESLRELEDLMAECVTPLAFLHMI